MYTKAEIIKKAKTISTIGISIFLTLYFYTKIVAPARNIFQSNEVIILNSDPFKKQFPALSVKDTVYINDKNSGQFFKGTLAYSISDTMYLNQRMRVGALITIDEIKEKVVSELKKTVHLSDEKDYLPEKKVTIESIEISNIMNIRLIDSSNEKEKSFQITSLNREEQIINFKQNSYTYWQWDVIPLKKGDLPLMLSVDIVIIDISDGKKIKSIPVFEKTVHVNSQLSREAKILRGKLIIGAAIIIFVFGVFFSFRLIDKNLIRKQIASSLELGGDLNRVEILISKDETKMAIDLLLRSFENKDKQLFKEAILLSSKFEGVREKYRLGLEENRLIDIEKAKINKGILDLVERVRSYKK